MGTLSQLWCSTANPADGTAATAANTGLQAFVTGANTATTWRSRIRSMANTGLEFVTGGGTDSRRMQLLPVASMTRRISGVFETPPSAPSATVTVLAPRTSAGVGFRFQWTTTGAFQVLDTGSVPRVIALAGVMALGVDYKVRAWFTVAGTGASKLHVQVWDLAELNLVAALDSDVVNLGTNAVTHYDFDPGGVASRYGWGEFQDEDGVEAHMPFYVPSMPGGIKVWTGATWAVKPLKVWTGAAWVPKPVRRWSGTAWVSSTAFGFTQPPTIGGFGVLGATMAANSGQQSDNADSFSYQWMQNGLAILGATAGTYIVTAADSGTTLSCAVTAIKGSATATATSNSIQVPLNFMQDSMTDTAGTFLTSHKGELAATWTASSVATSGSALITAGGTVRKGSVNNELWYSTAAPTSPDYVVEADYLAASNPASSSLGINGRMIPASNSFYTLRYSSTSGGWFITKTVNGAQSSLVSLIVALTVGRRYHIKLTMMGTLLEGYVEGVKILTTNDSSITPAGTIGYQNNSGVANSDASGYQLDNVIGHY